MLAIPTIAMPRGTARKKGVVSQPIQGKGVGHLEGLVAESPKRRKKNQTNPKQTTHPKKTHARRARTTTKWWGLGHRKLRNYIGRRPLSHTEGLKSGKGPGDLKGILIAHRLGLLILASITRLRGEFEGRGSTLWAFPYPEEPSETILDVGERNWGATGPK